MAHLDLRNLIRETVEKTMKKDISEETFEERKLTPAEEKKKEELVKALKPKYGKTPKTYAIATAKAKELAEDDQSNEKEGQILKPRFGINASSKWLAIVYKDGEVDDNKYFDTEEEAQEWIDDCCKQIDVNEVEFSKKYDDSEHLTDKQKRLPDEVQKGIIDKMSEKDIEEIRNLSHNAKRVAGAIGKENLPYHAPIVAKEGSKDEYTKKYDNHPFLKDKQKTDLPDKLQGVIIKSKGGKTEEDELDEKNMSFSYLKSSRANPEEKKKIKKGMHHLEEMNLAELQKIRKAVQRKLQELRNKSPEVAEPEIEDPEVIPDIRPNDPKTKPNTRPKINPFAPDENDPHVLPHLIPQGKNDFEELEIEEPKEIKRDLDRDYDENTKRWKEQIKKWEEERNRREQQEKKEREEQERWKIKKDNDESDFDREELSRELERRKNEIMNELKKLQSEGPEVAEPEIEDPEVIPDVRPNEPKTKPNVRPNINPFAPDENDPHVLPHLIPQGKSSFDKVISRYVNLKK